MLTVLLGAMMKTNDTFQVHQEARSTVEKDAVRSSWDSNDWPEVELMKNVISLRGQREADHQKFPAE